MLRRNIIFRLTPVRPSKNKFERFMLMQPKFALKKIWFAKELKGTDLMEETENELAKVVASGIASLHDEAIDCISMLHSLDLQAPSSGSQEFKYENGEFIIDVEPEEINNPLIL